MRASICAVLPIVLHEYDDRRGQFLCQTDGRSENYIIIRLKNMRFILSDFEIKQFGRIFKQYVLHVRIGDRFL